MNTYSVARMYCPEAPTGTLIPEQTLPISPDYPGVDCTYRAPGAGWEPMRFTPTPREAE